MRFLSPGFLLRAFLQVCLRFPTTMLTAFIGVVVSILAIENTMGNREDLFRTWMVAQLGLALLTGLTAYAESAGWATRRKLILQGLGLVLLAGYEWYLQKQPEEGFDTIELLRFTFFLIAAHMFASVAPYLNRRAVSDFWEFNRELFANFVVGATFTLIIHSGLSLAILAMDLLFDLDIDSLIYARLFIVLAGIFNTTYFLYHFPQKYEFETEDASYNAVFRNLCKYILIPIVVLYFVILYAYGARIVASGSLPKGYISSLVIGFSVAGIFAYLLNFYLPEYDSSLIVRLYKKWFWPVLLPLTALLFVAIEKRISDYGVTEPRYVVFTTGIWLAVACLYFLFSKTDNIKFIPISLGLTCLIVAMGPWSAFAVSEHSQVNHLRVRLEPNGRWENGKIKQSNQPITPGEVYQVESVLYYFESRGKLEYAEWLPMPASAFPDPKNSFSKSPLILKWLNLNNGVPESTRLKVSDEASPGFTDIRGYSRYIAVNLSEYPEAKPKTGPFLQLSKDGKKMLWMEAPNPLPLDSFDLHPILRSWRKQTTEENLILTTPNITYNLASRKNKIRLHILDAVMEGSDENYRINYLRGEMFVK